MKNFVIVGLGSIAHRVAEGIVEAKNARLYGVCSRDAKKASAFAKAYDDVNIFDDFEMMLKDENVDIVYLATPNKVHYEQIKKSLNMQKHVVCEKPMVNSLEALEELFSLAKEQKCFLMEAEKTVFTPLNQKIMEYIQYGSIGDVIAIEATYANTFYYHSENLSHWVFQKEDGGAMFDIGVYPVCYANFIANSRIAKIESSSVYTKEGYDVYNKALLTYENGIVASVTCSWITANENFGFIYGTKGYIKTKQFWKNNEAILVYDGHEEAIKVDLCSDFRGEMEHAVEYVEAGLCESPVLGYEQTKEILTVVLETKKQPARII